MYNNLDTEKVATFTCNGTLSASIRYTGIRPSEQSRQGIQSARRSVQSSEFRRRGRQSTTESLYLHKMYCIPYSTIQARAMFMEVYGFLTKTNDSCPILDAFSKKTGKQPSVEGYIKQSY